MEVQNTKIKDTEYQNGGTEYQNGGYREIK